MLNRSALMVSLATDKWKKETEADGDADVSSSRKVKEDTIHNDVKDTSSEITTRKRRVREWISKIPTNKASGKKEIKIISNVVIQKSTSNSFVPQSPNDSDSKSAISNTTFGSTKDPFANSDDTYFDPHYIPSVSSKDFEEESNTEIRQQADIFYVPKEPVTHIYEKEEKEKKLSHKIAVSSTETRKDNLACCSSAETEEKRKEEQVPKTNSFLSKRCMSNEIFQLAVSSTNTKEDNHACHGNRETEEKPKEEQVEKTIRRNYKDRKDFCIFCEKDVSHFARHLTTWHASEFDVLRITSIKDSKEKRIAFANLRKKGNFVRNRTSITLRPVKMLKTNDVGNVTADDYLPCKHCLGFYRRKTLYRHTKKCSLNPDIGQLPKRQISQSDGQTTLLLGTLLKHDQLLNSELFPRMRADDVSLTAKKDSLICNYAYCYLKGRRSKGNLDLVRQNVRRLAKLLLFCRKRDEKIKDLIDLLRPQYFKIIINGVSELACYNNSTERYDSPTLAMNFGTLLKKCCDLAIIQLLQKPNTKEQKEDANMLKTLIISQWADEVSAQAATNLNENNWNKEELLPLTSDLKKLNLHLQITAREAFNKLKVDKTDSAAYNMLKEVLYTQIILLNRRRPAEVAQLKVQTYKSINLNSAQNEEFENCLTETEKILLSTYSRFVIRGKRGRGVPVLLSPEMRNHFDFLIEVRDRFAGDNNYIFHTKGMGFLDGTKTLHKQVKKCGVTRAESITATRLRKHLATITQLLSFSNNDMEQLSKFMGHTLKTHCNVYRMSDNIYQTAKVSKLLLLMMEGGAENFKGKELDQIDLDLAPVFDSQDIFEDLEPAETCPDEISTSEPKEVNEREVTKKPNKRQSWSTQQKRIIADYFKENIKRKEPPKVTEVNHFIELYFDLFKDRKWTSIKAIVYNIYTGKLKVK